jgi:hypothetical protein
VDNPLGLWKKTGGTLNVAAPTGIAGSPAGTLLVYGGTQVAAQDLRERNPDWTDLPPLPGDAVGVGGDLNVSLYAVVNAGKGSQVLKYLPPVPKQASAKPSTDPQPAAAGKPAAPEMTPPAWSESVLDIPFNVSLMCGDTRSGFVFYGEGQILSIQDFAKKPSPLASPPFRLTALSGNAKDGLVGVAGQGDFIVYCLDPSKPVWNVALGPLAEQDAPA